MSCTTRTWNSHFSRKPMVVIPLADARDARSRGNSRHSFGPHRPMHLWDTPEGSEHYTEMLVERHRGTWASTEFIRSIIKLDSGAITGNSTGDMVYSAGMVVMIKEAHEWTQGVHGIMANTAGACEHRAIFPKREFSENSPFNKFGIPQANSTTSRPLVNEPLASS